MASRYLLELEAEIKLQTESGIALLSDPGAGGTDIEFATKSSGALFPANESNSSFMCLVGYT